MGIREFLKSLTSPRNSAAFTQLNFLLGSGPLIVPMPFFQAGFLFSTIWTILVWFLNFTTARYIGQSIVLVNLHQKEKKSSTQMESSEVQVIKKSDTGSEQTEQPKRIKTFDHDQLIVYLYGQKWKPVPCMSVSLYLLGSAISRCIITGKTLSGLFAGVSVLEKYEFWLSVFFVSGALFSFRSIEKTKIVQTIIFLVRFLSISLMIIGALVIIGNNGGIQSLTPSDGNAFFNGKYFSPVFSNLIFTFMCNHSLPGMTKQLTDLNQISSFINIGYTMAIIFMLIIPITASLAFGNSLTGDSANNKSGYQLIYYNQNFQGRLDFVYYIVSFYIFLNIATFSVSVIVIRRYILAMVASDKDSDTLDLSTAITTVVILAVILFIAFFLGDNVQIALNFTGVLGCLIMFVLPSLEVIGARKLFIGEKESYAKAVWAPIVMIVLGVTSMVFNLYQTITDIKG